MQETRIFDSYKARQDFLDSPEGRMFSGVMYYYELGYNQKVLNSWSKDCYENGKIHCATGPAKFWFYFTKAPYTEAEILLVPDPEAYTKTFWLLGEEKTKKAWSSAINNSMKPGSKTIQESLVSKFRFNGSFWSQEFEFHGHEDVLLAVRSGTCWFVLDKGSRSTGQITKRINQIVKEKDPNRKEVSQSELEETFVDNFKGCFV